MINHGLSTGALFLLVGMVYEQTHTREFKVYGGLWKVMPIFGTIIPDRVAFFDGLARLERFRRRVHDLARRLGRWIERRPYGSFWYAGISALGVIMAAVYILYMFQKMFIGPEGSIVEEVKKHGHALRDLNAREIITVVPLLIFIFWIGLYPAPFFHLMAPAVDKLVAGLQTAATAMR